MTSLPRAIARRDGRVFGFANRADMLAALATVHLKPSELRLFFRCSRGVADKMMNLANFPVPFDLTGDGKNLRYSVDEVMTYRDAHRREIRALVSPPKRRALPPQKIAACAGPPGAPGGPTGFR